MKTYLLRHANPVEPQRRSAPRTTTSAILGRPASAKNGPVLFVGLDVHTDSIAVSLAPVSRQQPGFLDKWSINVGLGWVRAAQGC